jgi:hypothetical protein
MSSIGSNFGLDPSVLLGYYQTQLASSPSARAAANALNEATAARSNSATANDDPPWETLSTGINNARTAKILSTTDFLDTSNVPLTPGATSDAKTEQDNQRLFSLYNAVNSLSYLAQLAQSSKATGGQLAGLNTRFQAGLAQVQKYIASTGFNNFTLQAATPSNTVTSTAAIPFSDYTYSTRQLAGAGTIDKPLSGVSASDSFTIAIKKGGATTAVNIDFSQVQGPLTLTNIVSYINSQLSADGFATRFQKTESGGTATSDAIATYGLQISPGGAETVSLSAAATPSLYLAGNSGLATETNTTINSATSDITTTPPDLTGRLTKISGLGGSPTGTFSVNQSATSGTTTAGATAVDASGNVYVIGTATGDFGNQINQGAQDVYLTKYDSAGHALWSDLLGSAGSASGYGLALDPAGGAVVTGASTADLTPTSVADGNNDSFVARYDANGSQIWIKQIQTLAANQANAVSVDASGNVYIGGQVSGGVVGKGQAALGKGDAYLAKFDSKGNLVAENQFGTSGADSVGATATGSDGSLYVAGVQNGEAIVSKYAGGDITSAPTWTQDLGALQAGGTIGGLAVANGQVYVSGTTGNPNLTAGGQAGVAAAASGGADAFVFNLTDNGAGATAGHVTYIGTAGTEQGGAVTVGPDGTVYLAGSTTGTFAGQVRSAANLTNAFASAINADGSIQWTRQYGGADGQSTGAGIAVDPQGSSVLDALGLPRGTINLNQSVDLTQQTTLRAGDSFQIKIDGPAPRTATITIDKGETLTSLSTKINAQLGAVGKATTNYVSHSEGLKLTVNPGNTIELISGPADFDALGRLGIAPGTLTAVAANASGANPAGAGTATTAQTFGLGLTGTLDISTKTGADLARSQLLSMLSNLQTAYRKTNTPPPLPTVGNTSGTASPALASQLGSYNLALTLLGTSSGDAVNTIAAIVAGGV